MHCQSVNGNLNCSGSGDVACQTIDGRHVYVSGHGDVIQSFGNDGASDWSGHHADNDGDPAGRNDTPAPPVLKQRWQPDLTL